MVPVIFRAKEIDYALRALMFLEVTETFVLTMMSRRPTGGLPRLFPFGATPPRPGSRPRARRGRRAVARPPMRAHRWSTEEAG